MVIWIFVSKEKISLDRRLKDNGRKDKRADWKINWYNSLGVIDMRILNFIKEFLDWEMSPFNIALFLFGATNLGLSLGFLIREHNFYGFFIFGMIAIFILHFPTIDFIKYHLIKIGEQDNETKTQNKKIIHTRKELQT